MRRVEGVSPGSLPGRVSAVPAVSALIVVRVRAARKSTLLKHMLSPIRINAARRASSWTLSYIYNHFHTIVHLSFDNIVQANLQRLAAIVDDHSRGKCAIGFDSDAKQSNRAIMTMWCEFSHQNQTLNETRIRNSHNNEKETIRI